MSASTDSSSTSPAPSHPNIAIHLHTYDLRTIDSPILNLIHSSKHRSVTHFLPVYVFDERYVNLTCLPDYKACNTKGSDNKDAKSEAEKQLSGPRTRRGKFHRTGRHRVKFLIEAVMDLKKRYQEKGSDLILMAGKTEEVMEGLVKGLKEQDGNVRIEGVWMQKEVATEEVHMIRNTRSLLSNHSVQLNLIDSRTMMDPKDLPFKVEDMPNVFTAFRKQVEGLGDDMFRDPLPDVQKIKPCPKLPSCTTFTFPYVFPESLLTPSSLMPYLIAPLIAEPTMGDSIPPTPVPQTPTEWSSYKLPPVDPNTAFPFNGGETTAQDRLTDYLGTTTGGKLGKGEGGEKGQTYKQTRNGLLGEGFSSKFSAWLNLGCMSPRYTVWRIRKLRERLEAEGKWDKLTQENTYWLIFELEWLDFFFFTCEKFSHLTPFSASKTHKHKLHASEPALLSEAGTSSTFFNLGGMEEVMKPKESAKKLGEWKEVDLSRKDDMGRRFVEGRTGVPFIDASMRELARTGYTGNRMRQNVASFLAADLYVDWRIGAEWYESMLIDHSVYSNTGNWQYQAGVGNDPRAFRQFSSIKQHNDYDPNDEYVRTWLPELGQVGADMIIHPWLLSDLEKKSFDIGTTPDSYPGQPLIEQSSWMKHYRTNGRFGKARNADGGGNGEQHSGGKSRGGGGQRGRGGRGGGRRGETVGHVRRGQGGGRDHRGEKQVQAAQDD